MDGLLSQRKPPAAMQGLLGSGAPAVLGPNGLDETNAAIGRLTGLLGAPSGDEAGNLAALDAAQRGTAINSPERMAFWEAAYPYFMNAATIRGTGGNFNPGLETSAVEGKARAQAGGETGMNGYIYKGGQFLPNTEAPPGTWRVKRKGKAINIPNGRELVSPGDLQPRPTPFSKSVYQGLQEFTDIGPDGKLRLKDGINWEYWGDPGDKSPMMFKQLAVSKDGYSILDRIDLYNKGVRWIDLEPAPGVEIVDKSK